MPGLVPGIHVLMCRAKIVDGRDKPGHDGAEGLRKRKPERIRELNASTLQTALAPSWVKPR